MSSAARAAVLIALVLAAAGLIALAILTGHTAVAIVLAILAVAAGTGLAPVERRCSVEEEA